MKKFLKVGEVAELCGCCEKTVRKFTDGGRIICFRNVWGHRLIPLRETIKLQKLLVGEKPAQL